jgi:hypothetical protein
MTRHFIKTLQNGEKHYRESGHSISARIFDNGGFTSTIYTEDRAYNVVTRIDRDAEVVVMEVSPGIICCKESLPQVSEYITQINANYKTCNLRINSNGHLYVQTEQRFINAPVDSDTFESMEHNSLIILDTFATVLDKLAHLKLIDADEADIEKVVQNHRKKVLQVQSEDPKSAIEELLEKARRDSSSIGDGSSAKSGLPSFEEWRKHTEAGSLAMDGIDIDDDFDLFNDEAAAQEDEERTGLLAALLEMSGDETDENAEPEESGVTAVDEEDAE